MGTSCLVQMGTSCCVTAESWYRSGAVQRILKAAHEGHPRVSRTKARLRCSVYWPSLTKDVDQELKPCLACQATTEGKHHQDLLHPSQPPQKPWSKLGGDHWGPIPDRSGYTSSYHRITSQNTQKPYLRQQKQIYGHWKKCLADMGTLKARHRQQPTMERDGIPCNQGVSKMGRGETRPHAEC